jgi:hypothetical protein
MLPKDDTNRY